MADPNHPRHFEESFKRQIVRLYEAGKPAREIRAEYDICHSTPRRWVQGICNGGSTRAEGNRTPEQNELIEPGKLNRQPGWRSTFKNKRRRYSHESRRDTGQRRPLPGIGAMQDTGRSQFHLLLDGGTSGNGEGRSDRG